MRLEVGDLVGLTVKGVSEGEPLVASMGTGRLLAANTPGGFTDCGTEKWF